MRKRMDIFGQFSGIFKKLLIGYLVCFWAFAPLSVWGAPLQPDGSTHTTLDAARNGVPIVNIASPNASGLSHNRFTHYNVNKNGLILNNGRTTAVKTQLGGYIAGNPHLTNNAKLILNEVTSTHRTALNGFTEVAGPRTDLVIANPNGLTINGAGFINTNRVALTTGRPVIIGGALTSLNVTGGDIAIQGAGLNTQGASATSIYTQYLNLNAKVHANNLDIKLGGNSVNYQTGAAVSNGAANGRSVLLDTSALGGMYANRIMLVGTDKGLGVNLPPEVLASMGDISISNDGMIVLQTVSAGGNVSVNSSGSNVTAAKSVYAGATASVSAKKAVTVNVGAAIAAGGAVNANAMTVSNQGVIAGGLTAAGGQKPGGAVHVNAASVTNSGDMLASGGMGVKATGALTNGGTISSGGALSVKAASLTNTGAISGGTGASNITVSGNIDNSSRISAAGDLAVRGANIVNNGFFNAGNNLTMTSTNLTNNQTLFSGNNMNLYTSGALTNNPNANIFAMNNLTMAANAGLGNTASIVNDQANIESFQGNIDIHAASLVNRTKPPVIQGSYNAATQSIVGGKRLSTTTTTTYCGFHCSNVTTTTVDTMVLKSSSTPATINAGGNLNVNATNITSQYSLMSAGGNIHLAAKVVDNQPKNILKVTTVSTAMFRNQRYCNRRRFGFCTGHANRSVYVGTSVSTGKQVLNTVASTIQAGGSITGNVANLSNGNIKQHQTIAASISQTQNTSATPVSTAVSAITLPVGSTGLFVVSPNSKAKYLIETNPAFASFGNFIGSSYLLSRIGYKPVLNVKLLGDALYENRLIRDSIFAQTGRRFLRRDITSDYAQYQYLMDNALAAREGLQLIPGVALTAAQIAALTSDIVWLVEREVAGQKVLAPVVYIASSHDYRIEGGRIIAGDDINLLVDRLNNSGILEAGHDLNVDAGDTITNQDGSIRAGGKLSLLAKNNIENISAAMRAKNITLVSSNGNIINRRYLETQSFAGGNDVKTVTGTAGSIIATGNLALNAGKTIAITGSKLKGGNISLKANQVNIGTTVTTSSFDAAVKGVSLKQQSTTHLGSVVEGSNIAINSTGATTVSGSRVHADENLNIKAGKLDVLAVNDSSYEENRTTSKGFMSHQSTTTKHATSTNIGSQLSGGNVSLSTTKGDKVNGEAREGALGHITVVGSEVSAENKLALDSAKNIDVRAGFDGAMNETHTKKSGFFTGGHLFSKSEDLEGKLTKTAVLAKLSGRDVSLTAGKDMALRGVDVAAKDSLTGKAQNITVENVNNEEKTWSKHEKLTVGFGDALKSIVQPYKAVKYKDGKASITLARAEFSKADKTTTKTTVVGSNLQANNINLTAGSGGEGDDSHHSDGIAREDATEHKVNGVAGEGALGHEGDDHQPDAQGKGNINITGSNLTARNDVNLTASNNVTIKEAKNTERTASKDMHGTAELKLSVKNEYVQIGYAVNEARKSEKNLKNTKQAYTRYRRELGRQRGKLIKLKADLANGKIGIEQADVDEMAGLIGDLKADDTFYKANIALATSDLAAKTLAVAAQMAKAVSAPAYGFSASLELDLDTLEKKFNAYKEQSVASNLNARDINIAANNAATVRGSNLNASNQIDINAGDTNILASQDVNTSSNSSDHQHTNISYGTSGGFSGSASADRSRGSSDGITNHNSQLVASNINITTKDRTAIKGANIHASDKLNIHTKYLDVASVQDSNNSRSNSQGFSVSGTLSGGVSGVGANMGMSHSRARETVLTTLTGNNVNINVAKDTKLKGAMIAATTSQGNDNGHLKLKTGTLEVSSLNNTHTSKSLSAGLNMGIANREQRDHSNKSTASSVGIDFSNDRANSKTKTLGTIGKGSVEVASVDKSNTKMLNRDIKDNTVDIYNIQSHKGLKGSLDTRLLTKKGQAQIAEDVLKAGIILNTIKLIATTDKVKTTDFFKETGKANKTYEAVKAEVAKSPALANALQSPKLSPQQKKAMLNAVTRAVMVKLGYKAYDNVIVATDAPGKGGEQVAGYASKETGNAYINDRYNSSTKDLITTAGHEAAHIMDNQHHVASKDGETYANNYGENLANYTGMALDINGYGGMTSTNSHSGNRSEYVTRNNAEFKGLDKNKGDNCGEGICLGAAVGFLTDVGVQATINVITGKPINDINIKQALGSAALGATGVGIANVIGKGAKAISVARELSKAQTVVAQHAAGAVADAATSVVTKKAKGEKITAKGVGLDVLAAQLGGTAGSRLAKTSAIKSPMYKGLDAKAERASRMASPVKKNGLPRKVGRPKAKQRQAAKANAVRDAFVDGNVTRAAIVGSGAAGGLVEAGKSVATQNKERK